MILSLVSGIAGLKKKILRALLGHSGRVLWVARAGRDPGAGSFPFLFRSQPPILLSIDRGFVETLRDVFLREVVVDADGLGSLPGPAALSARRLVVILRNPAAGGPEGLSPGWKRWLYFAAADQIVVFSEDSARLLRDLGAPAGKVRCLPPPDGSAAAETAWEAFYGEIGLAPSRPVRMTLDRCGLAVREDLDLPEVKALKREMEGFQREFLERDTEVWKNWRWPRDVLNTWSRRWEYPYVYHHLKKILPNGGTVLDVGSGLHFFSFFLGERGYEVVGCDFDLALAGHFPAFARGAKRPPRMVIADMEALPVRDRSVDAVVCLSVIEHLPAWKSFPGEFHRVLKPGGALLVTLDVGLSETCRLSPDRFQKVQEDFEAHFVPLCPVRTASPQALLTTGWVRSWDPASVPFRETPFSFYNLLTRRWGRFYYDLAVAGFALAPKEK